MSITYEATWRCNECGQEELITDASTPRGWVTLTFEHATEKYTTTVQHGCGALCAGKLCARRAELEKAKP